MTPMRFAGSRPHHAHAMRKLTASRGAISRSLATMNNSKARSIALQQAARDLLVERGIDVRQQVDLQPLARALAQAQHCQMATAMRHVAQAVRRARGER